MFILGLLHGQCVNCLLLIIRNRYCAVLYGCVSMSKNSYPNGKRETPLNAHRSSAHRF